MPPPSCQSSDPVELLLRRILKSSLWWWEPLQWPRARRRSRLQPTARAPATPARPRTTPASSTAATPLRRKRTPAHRRATPLPGRTRPARGLSMAARLTRTPRLRRSAPLSCATDTDSLLEAADLKPRRYDYLAIRRRQGSWDQLPTEAPTPGPTPRLGAQRDGRALRDRDDGRLR